MPGLDLGAPVVVAVAYGLIVPDEVLAERLWLNVHPSLLPRWRGAAPVERALMAGDRETGVTIIRLVHELDAGPIAAQERFPIAADDDAGVVYARAAEVAVTSARRRARRVGPTLREQAGEPTYAAKIDAADRSLDLELPADELVEPRARAVAAHRRPRGAPRSPAHGLARSGRRRRVVRAGRGAARRRAPHGLRRMAPRAAAVSPARAAAFDVLLRVFEDGAYADRALRRAAQGLDERDRALAQLLAFGAVQRRRTLDHAIEVLGRRRVARLDPPVRAALRLGAFQLAYVDGVARYAAVNESVELVRRARARARGRVHERRPASPCRRDPAARRRASREHGARGGAQALVPRLDRRDVVARPRSRRMRARRMRALNEPGATVVRLVRGEIAGKPDPASRAPGTSTGSTRRALAEGRIWPQSAASQLVGLAVGSRDGERVLDLCAAPGGKATMLAGEVTAVEVNEARARELEENARRLGASNVSVVVADGRELPRLARRLRPCARRRSLLGARRPQSPPRPALACGAAARAPARAPALGGGACASRRLDRLLGLHGERGRVGGRRRCVRAHGRRDARGRVAAVPASSPARVPADAAARRRNRRVLRRPTAPLITRRGSGARSRRSTPTSRLARPSPRRARARPASRPVEFALADERLRVDDEPRLPFGSEDVVAVEILVRERVPGRVDGPVDVERGFEERARRVSSRARSRTAPRPSQRARASASCSASA